MTSLSGGGVGWLLRPSQAWQQTWASQMSSESVSQVESTSEVWWLRFSATPPLRRCPLCLCVLAGGLSEDPSHPGNWWACDAIPRSHRLTTSPPRFGASHQSVLREIRSRESPPPSCLGYHGNQRRSRQHLALVRRGGEGGRRSRKETGENGREGSKGRADSGQEEEYLSDLQQDLACRPSAL